MKTEYYETSENSLHFQTTQRLRRYPRAELEGVLAGWSLVNVRVILDTHRRFRVLEIDDELAIPHQRRQAQLLLLDLGAHQQLQREEMLVVRLRQVTVHELRQSVTGQMNASLRVISALLVTSAC